MKGSSFYPVLVAAILFNTLLLTTFISAQSLCIDQKRSNFVSLDVLKPVFNESQDLAFTSASYFLSGRFLLEENIIMICELPVAHGSTGQSYGGYYDNSETTIGNPYLGFEIRKQKAPLFVEFGVRLPLTPSQFPLASFVGKYSDYERQEAFRTNILTLTGKVNYFDDFSSNVFYRLHIGPTLWLYSKGHDDLYLWIDYSGQVGYKFDIYSFMGGITGRLLTTEIKFDLDKRTFHHLKLAASVALNTIHPGIQFSFPIDKDLNSIYDFVVGLNLSVQLP